MLQLQLRNYIGKSLSQLENVYRIMTNMGLIKDQYTYNFFIHLQIRFKFYKYRRDTRNRAVNEILKRFVQRT